MSTFTGITEIESAYFGSTEVDAIYKGSTEVWANAAPAQITTVISSYSNGRLNGAFKDAGGNIYFNINSGSGSSGSSYTVKCNSSFGITWSHYVSSSYGGSLNLFADASENIYIGGFHGHSPGDYYAHVKKINTSTGLTTWGKEEGGGQTYMHNLVGNKDGVVGEATHSSAGHAHWAVYNTDGSTKWNRSVPNNGNPRLGLGTNYAVGIRGGIFYVYTIGGSFVRSHDFSAYGGSEWAACIDEDDNYILSIWSGGNDPTILIVKFDSAGNKVWERTLDQTASFSASTGIIVPRVDAKGAVYFAHHGVTATESVSMLFISKIDANGNIKYMKRLTNTSNLGLSAGYFNISETRRKMYLCGWFNDDGYLYEFDLNNGGKSGTSATVSGTTFTISDEPYTVSNTDTSYTTSTSESYTGGITISNRDSYNGNSPSFSAANTTFA